MKKITFTIFITMNILCTLNWNYNNFQVLYNENKVITATGTNLTDKSNYIYDISIKQVQIWKNIKNNNTNESYSSSRSEILKTLNKLEYYSEMDIITLLDASIDQKDTLQNYLLESSNIIEESDYFIKNIEFEIKNNISELERCSKQKSLSDKTYFQSLNNGDLTSMNSSIIQSKKADECISTNRIEANSKQAILNKLLILRETLQSKYTFLYQKQSLILDNFQVIKGNFAKELSQTTDILNQYQIDQ